MMPIITTQVPPGLRFRDGAWWLCTTIRVDGVEHEVWIPFSPADLFEQLFSLAIGPRLRARE